MSLKYIVIKNTFPVFLSNAVSSMFIFAYFSSFYIFSVKRKGNFFVLKHIMEATKLQLDWQRQVVAGFYGGAVFYLSNADDSIWHQSIQCWQCSPSVFFGWIYQATHIETPRRCHPQMTTQECSQTPFLERTPKEALHERYWFTLGVMRMWLAWPVSRMLTP